MVVKLDLALVLEERAAVLALVADEGERNPRCRNREQEGQPEGEHTATGQIGREDGQASVDYRAMPGRGPW